IYHGDGRGRLAPDESYAAHIAKDWAPDAIEEVLHGLADTLSIRPQAGIEQRAFKRSYVISDMAIRHTVEAALLEAGLPARVVASHGTLLDILPARAGKGAARAWCAEAYGIAPEASVAAGDSGNDIDMLSGTAAGVMVANRSSELRTLDRAPNVYTARARHADGVLEGLAHWHPGTVPAKRRVHKRPGLGAAKVGAARRALPTGREVRA
ncbi:MAG: HAD family hydrolase, partial [Pseudomonadota bacterium]